MQYRRSCERRDLALLGKIDKWAAPKYWAEVEYRDVTTDGLLRMWRFVVCTPIGRLRPRSSASSRLLRRSVVSFIASLRIAKKSTVIRSLRRCTVAIPGIAQRMLWYDPMPLKKYLSTASSADTYSFGDQRRCDTHANKDGHTSRKWAARLDDPFYEWSE